MGFTGKPRKVSRPSPAGPEAEAFNEGYRKQKVPCPYHGELPPDAESGPQGSGWWCDGKDYMTNGS